MPVDTERDLAAEMEAFLEGQCDRYGRVLELGRRQRDCIEKRQTEPLMEILAEKQALIREIDTAAREHQELLRAWEAGREAYSADRRAELEALHERLKTVLLEVMKAEDACRELLDRSVGDQGRKLAGMQRGKRMLKAYGVKPPASPRFKDQSS